MPEREVEKLSQALVRGLLLATLLGVGLVVGLLIVYRLLGILEVIAIAILLALVLRTIARGLESVGASPMVSAAVLLAGVGGVGALLWFVVVPNVAQEIRVLNSEGPGTLDSLANLLRGLPFAPELSEVLQRLEKDLSRLTSVVPSLLFTTTKMIGAVVSVVFLAIYFAVSPDTYLRGALRLVPEHRRASAEALIGVLGERLRGWIVGTAIVASFVGVGGGLGLWILGVPLPLTFGILAGVLDVIPFFGSIVGGLLPALLALTISPIKALEVVVLFLVLNQIEGNILQPQIMGHEVQIPQAMVLISILILGTLLGPIFGTLLAVPTAVLVSVVMDELTSEQDSLEE